MQRVVLQDPTSNPNFIGAWIMEPVSLCDDLIAYFETQRGKQTKGVSAGRLNPDIKNSVDISVLPNEISLPGNEVFREYFKALFSCHKDYLAQWLIFEGFAKELGNFNKINDLF